ncbi:hypothetical protein [Cytophaga hutchinsonii]|uniref:Outer membrane protein beta-barrel domain-containing protein n=1 Tax=Cytophaga hutchinsonii (strain ATCC 33406 / DSM 1761 / CIP 103989 / NBRC 15051 / NCIMB 9469 / D465) TaxID=269798 RepID=A0A6N4SRD0_CYTH3|nr:hypothetical protein [Cytophaga hutchinsonii]ABG58859.1 hypothetical protein CHU_1589 [Cytophaga hutchinsonii ATCC 33406]SFX80794.1 hypothetical protein SAMN04487930_11056 [Cytophaga hutchinsonii ATCC 33406]
MKYSLFVFLFLLTNAFVFAQSETPRRRDFNIGTFTGIGGASLMPIPTLDVRYKGTTLRIAPGYKYNGVGVTQELFPFSKTFYNIYWLASVYYVRGTESKHANATTDFNAYSLLGGLKYYMGTRFFSELQLGAEYREKSTPGYASTNNVSPYFEFGIGINLFRNYPKKVTTIGGGE